MTPWEKEQRDYLLSKEESQELAAICFGAIGIMVLIGLALEMWQRTFG